MNAITAANADRLTPREFRNALQVGDVVAYRHDCWPYGDYREVKVVRVAATRITIDAPHYGKITFMRESGKVVGNGKHEYNTHRIFAMSDSIREQAATSELRIRYNRVRASVKAASAVLNNLTIEKVEAFEKAIAAING